MRDMLLCFFLFSSILFAQPLKPGPQEVALPGGAALEVSFLPPAGFDEARPHPVLVFVADGPSWSRGQASEKLEQEASRRGWLLLVLATGLDARLPGEVIEGLPLLFRRLRSSMAVEGCRLHLAAARGAMAEAERIRKAFPLEFASLTRPETAKEFWSNLKAERARLRRGDGPKAEAARFLDRWHEAAARADAAAYFDAFTGDGVFMGTDATERWTVPEFKAWAARAFERPSAWTFVPIERHMVLHTSGDLIFFDEVLGHGGRDEYRGSGVLRREGGAWKVAHYDLSLPVPNEIFHDLLQEIRTWRRAQEQDLDAKDALAPTTIYLVRHAEAEQGRGEKDPPLTERGLERSRRLADLLPAEKLSLIVATEFRRTRATVDPTARRAGRPVTTIPSQDLRGLVRRLRALPGSASALVAGHSNTIPRILRALGIRETFTIRESDHDDLFVVTLDRARKASLQRLRYRP